MNFLKKVLKISLLAAAIAMLAVLLSNIWIVRSTGDQVYDDVDQVPNNKVALVLGTSDKLSNGRPNPFFHTRINTAANLYHHGKVKHVLVSGDNRTQFYNEPLQMQKALIKKGVPESAITLDFAGLRTLDSIVRCKKIFGQQKITIITQPFHSFRALFISRFHKVDAVVLATGKVPRKYSMKVEAREYFARAKAVWDLYVVNKQPRHLGQKEYINTL